MCRIGRIDEFVARWPDAEFGPGHIVLSDANLSDSDLDYCLAVLGAVLDGGPGPRDEFKMHVVADNAGARMEPIEPREAPDYKAEYAGHGHDELVATREFLLALRSIPEAQRVEAGDQLCEVLE